MKTIKKYFHLSIRSVSAFYNYNHHQLSILSPCVCVSDLFTKKTCSTRDTHTHTHFADDVDLNKFFVARGQSKNRCAFSISLFYFRVCICGSYVMWCGAHTSFNEIISNSRIQKQSSKIAIVIPSCYPYVCMHANMHTQTDR